MTQRVILTLDLNNSCCSGVCLCSIRTVQFDSFWQILDNSLCQMLFNEMRGPIYSPGRCLDLYGAHESITRQTLQKSLCHSWPKGAWRSPTGNSHCCKFWQIYSLLSYAQHGYCEGCVVIVTGDIRIFFQMINCCCNSQCAFYNRYGILVDNYFDWVRSL